MPKRKSFLTVLTLAAFFAGQRPATAQTSSVSDPDTLSKKALGMAFPLTQCYLNYDLKNPTPDHKHAGVDFGSIQSGNMCVTPIKGRAVKAVKGGAVIRAGNNAGGLDAYGTVAIYDGTNTVIYLHLEKIVVTNNMSIPAGTLIGYAGATGTNSPHLHIEVRRGKNYVAVGPGSLPADTPKLTLDPFYYLLH